MPIAEAIAILSVSGALISAFHDSVGLFQKWRAKRKKERVKRLAKAEEVIASLSRSPEEVGRTRDRGLEIMGSRFGRGDRIAISALTRVNDRFHADLIDILQTAIASNNQTLNLAALLDASETGRRDSVDVMMELLQRLSVSARLRPAPGPPKTVWETRRDENGVYPARKSHRETPARRPYISSLETDDFFKPQPIPTVPSPRPTPMRSLIDYQDEKGGEERGDCPKVPLTHRAPSTSSSRRSSAQVLQDNLEALSAPGRPTPFLPSGRTSNATPPSLPSRSPSSSTQSSRRSTNALSSTSSFSSTPTKASDRILQDNLATLSSPRGFTPNIASASAALLHHPYVPPPPVAKHQHTSPAPSCTPPTTQGVAGPDTASPTPTSAFQRTLSWAAGVSSAGPFTSGGLRHLTISTPDMWPRTP